MDRRTLLKGGAALAGAATLPSIPARAQGAPEKLRFGYAITQSGPLGPGSESTMVSQYRLWNKLVNDGGGIMLKKFGKRVPIELIGYDDQGKPDELLKLTTRLIEEDKVDMILAPYATHMNIASAPITNKYGFPVIYPTATTTTTYEFSKKFPFAFWQIAQPNEATGPLAEYLGQLMKEGKIKGRVATMHPAIEYGVQMNTAFQNAAKKAGLEVVFNRSYPFGASDLQPVIREMMGAKPDAAIAFSYPPDTFMLTEQMQIVGFNPDVMYVAIGGVFPTYKGKFGDKVNGILAYGGQDVSLPEYQAYLKSHREMHMRDSEAGALSTYSALEITQQAIERVGELDRQKIRDEIAGGTFKTVWGELSYTDQRCAQAWAVGQWQNGELHGVFPRDKPGAKPVQFPKPKWS